MHTFSKSVPFGFALIVGCGCAMHADRNFANEEQLLNMDEMRFKARYHRWVAAIYDSPHITLSSWSGPYTELAEFREIVKLGKSAIPYIAAEMTKEDSEFGLFLGEAVLKIQGWKRTDFDTGSLQDLNHLVLKRLKDEKRLPEAKE